MNDRLLDRKEAAKFLKISERTLDRLADLNRIKISQRRIVFRESDLQALIENRAGKRAIW